MLSIVFAVLTFMAGASASAMLGAGSGSQQYFPKTSPYTDIDPNNPSNPLPGLGGGTEGLGMPPAGPFSGGGELLKQAIPAISFAGGVFTLVTGIVSFLLFLGLGQACYVLLDLEEQQNRMENMLSLLTLRPGGR